MKRGWLIVGLLVLYMPLLVAQRGPVSDSRAALAAPEDVGLSSERLGRLTSAMQRYVDRGEIAGAVTLVSRHGRVAHLGSVGYRDLESRTPMTTDTIFRLASMTKPIVAVAALMLYEEGAFQLSDPIAKFLPEFRNMNVIQPGAVNGVYTVAPARTPITIRHALTHTSGVQNSDGALAADFATIAARSQPNDTLAEFVKRLAAMPLNFEPGAQWHYGPSGNSLQLVGRLVEAVSGQSLDQFLRTRIFDRLRMQDTYYYLPQEKLARFSTQYRPANGRIEVEDRPTADSIFFKERTFFSGGGGLVSTAADYARFQQMLLNGGELEGVRILGRKTVELMRSNHTGALLNARGPGNGFGLSVAVVTDLGATGQLGSEGMFGWGGAYGTFMFIDPKEDLFATLMIQLRPYAHLTIRNDFQTLVYQALIDSVPAPRGTN